MSGATVEYLDLGDEMAVCAATRNQARAQIAAHSGVDYVRVSVRREWRRQCTCGECLAGRANAVHGFDEWWLPCAKDDIGSVAWWVG